LNIKFVLSAFVVPTKKLFSVKQVAAVCIEPGGQFIDLTEPPLQER